MALVLVLMLAGTPVLANNRKIENEVLVKEKLDRFSKLNKKPASRHTTHFDWDKIKLSTALQHWDQRKQTGEVKSAIEEDNTFSKEGVQSPEKTTYVEQSWISFETSVIQSENLHHDINFALDKSSNLTTGKPHHYTTVNQYATFQSPVLSRPNHLLGPLHGPDWILDKSKIKRKKPLGISTGIEGTLLWAVGLFGTVQNGAIVVTGLFSPRFRQPLHILITTLAASDFFVSFVYIPTYTYFLLEGAQPDAAQGVDTPNVSFWSFCNLLRMIFIEIASVTLTIKVLISLYLYILTYSKKVTQVIFSYRNTFIFILLAWISNFGLLFVPNFVGLNSVDFYPNAVICIAQTPVSAMADDRVLMAYTLLTLALHIAELLMISLCFSKVLRAIQLGCNIWGQPTSKAMKTTTERKKDNTHVPTPQPPEHTQNKCDIHYHRAKRITVLFFITFVLCWLPIYLVNLVDPTHTKLPTLLHHVAMDMLLLKSAINPAIYVYGIKALRREMKVVCMCRCDRKGKEQNTFRTSMDSCPSRCDSTKTAQMV